MTTDDDGPFGNNSDSEEDSFDPSNNSNGAQSDSHAPDEPVETENQPPPQDNSTPPQGGQAPPPSGGSGPAPPPSGGGQGGPPSVARQINFKRIIPVVAIVAVVAIGVGFFALGGLPDIPAIGTCEADTSNVSMATHQGTGTDGERVAFQLTNNESVKHVQIMSGETEIANMTGIGNTTTVTGLSTGDSLTYVGTTECGTETVGNYTVE